MNPKKNVMKGSNPKCNAEMYPGDLFCGQCGLPLSIAVLSHAFENKMTGGATGGFDEALAQTARALVRRGRKIEAVKLVRERTGSGLKAAKDFVESL
ncbi:MAG: ribosomal protein L7/L12 [Blastocatellia bacterium]